MLVFKNELQVASEAATLSKKKKKYEYYAPYVDFFFSRLKCACRLIRAFKPFENDSKCSLTRCWYETGHEI